MAQKTQMQKTKSACTSANNEGLRFLQANIQHWLDHGDWEPLAYLLVHHPQKSVLRRVTRHCLVDGITFEADKKSKHGMAIAKPSQVKQAEITTAKYAFLEAMVAGRRGLNSRITVSNKSVLEVNHHFPTIAKADTKSDREKITAAAERLKKWCSDNGFNVSDVINALDAKPTNEVKETMPSKAAPKTDFTTNSDGSPVDAAPLSRGQKAAKTRRENAAKRAN